ncbi:hypothetical protein T09_1759, partial [Trichinella sp. T9]
LLYYLNICHKATQNHFPCVLIYSLCFISLLFLLTFIPFFCLRCFA